MQPYLSKTSVTAGLGSSSPRPLALKTNNLGLETAPTPTSFEDRPLQMKKKTQKKILKKKQDLESSEEINLTTFEETKDDDCINLQNIQNEFKEIPPTTTLNSQCHKRRRITEDSNDWNLSPTPSAYLSTLSNSDSPKKENSDSNEEPLDFHNDLDNLSPSLSPKNSFGEKLAYAKEKGRVVGATPKIKSTPPKSSDSESSKASVYSDSDNLSKLLSIARSLWCALKGKLLSTEVVSGRGGNKGLNFECCNKHQFIISLSTIAKLDKSTQGKTHYDSWCLKCRNFLQKTVERAQKMNSKIIDSCLSKGYVEIKCKNQHRFIVNYTKNHSKTWCEQCKEEEMVKKQQEFFQSQKLEEERKLREQQKLFEESQRHVQQEQHKRSMSFSSEQEAYYFDQTIKQIWTYCKKKTEREMLNPNFKGEASSVEIYNIYKILYLPFDVLVKSLLLIDRSQLNSHYRQLALLLHPDKNKYKLSKDAFTKLSNAYELCKKMI